jgi:phosphoglycolate phosphatase
VSFEARKIRALLFDLDGTLIDSEEDIAASANRLRASQGLQPLPRDVIGSFVGEGIEALVRKLMGPAFEAKIPALVEEFRRDYHEHCAEHTRLYPGVEPTLQALAKAGYKMAVVTNKPERISLRILELLGAGGHFGCVIGGNSCKSKKPDPEPLFEACRRLGVEIGAACMIGDSRVDIEAGRNAGIPALGILGGIGDEALMRAAGPSLVLEDFSGLQSVFGGAA